MIPLPHHPLPDASLQEAQEKLRHYADIHGDWVLTLTSDTARIIANGRRIVVRHLDDEIERARLWGFIVQFDAIASALAILQR